MSGAPGNVPPESLARPVQDGSWPADPFLLLREWAPENDDPDRPLATVATVDTEGMPDARTVLLTAVLDDGVTFHTDARSRKAEQLRARPVAAVVVSTTPSAVVPVSFTPTGASFVPVTVSVRLALLVRPAASRTV